MRHRLLGLSLAVVFFTGVPNGGQAASTVSSPGPVGPPNSEFVVGISPFLEKTTKDVVYRGLVGLLIERLPLGSKVTFYDAFHLKTIAEVTIPRAGAFNSPKLRANEFAAAIRDVRLFLAKELARPTNSHLGFEAAIRLPQFLDFLSENRQATQAAPAVLLIGSPLYQDAKEPAFSMVDGYFPSDGHLRATRERSVFGLAKDAGPGFSMSVHWVYFGDPWVSDLHRERVTRFWALYLEGRGVQLSAFTGDLPTVTQSLLQEPKGLAKRWQLSPEEKIEMLRIGRSVEIADWLTRDELPTGAPAPPTIRVGPLKIGIRWSANVDLDLYAAPSPNGETLFFQHVRSAEGYYYKDHRVAPGKEYEFIEFEAPVDIRQVEAFVNFYKGFCPGGPRGEVRIEFDGRIYSSPFSIRAEEGNLGRSGPSAEEFWTRIPVQELLRIVAPG